MEAYLPDASLDPPPCAPMSTAALIVASGNIHGTEAGAVGSLEPYMAVNAEPLPFPAHNATTSGLRFTSLKYAMEVAHYHIEGHNNLAFPRCDPELGCCGD